MKTINVLKNDVPYDITIPVEIISIRAYIEVGLGNGTTFYQAKNKDGIWFYFRKKDNKNKKLPVIKEFPHKEWINKYYGQWKAYSDEINI